MINLNYHGINNKIGILHITNKHLALPFYAHATLKSSQNLVSLIQHKVLAHGNLNKAFLNLNILIEH